MRRVLWIGDTHFGHREAGTGHRVIHLRGGGTYTASPKQQVINKEQRAMLDVASTCDVCVLNGDLIEGKDKKGGGKENVTNDIMTQCDMALDFFDKIHDGGKCKVIGTQGSLYHVEDNMSTDEYITKELDGDWDDDKALQLEKVTFHISHKIGASHTFQYRTTPIAKQLLDGILNEGQFGKFNIIGRNHAHYFVKVDYPSHMGFVGPGWKNRDAFGKRSSNPLDAPRLGYVLIDVDGGEYQFSKRTFSLPTEHLISWTRID